MLNAVLVLAATAAATAPDLPALLETLGREEARKDALGTCRFLERVRIEQLDGDGRVEGTIVREFAVERGPDFQRRKLLSEARTGEVSGTLAKVAKDPTPEERRASRSPFHPEAQKGYRFTGFGPIGADRLAVAFEPIETHPKKLSGRAVIDAKTRQVLTLTGVPSEVPMLVNEVKVEVDLAPTPCGVTMVRAKLSGSGGALFLKVRFRTVSEYRDFTLAK